MGEILLNVYKYILTTYESTPINSRETINLFFFREVSNCRHIGHSIDNQPLNQDASFAKVEFS